MEDEQVKQEAAKEARKAKGHEPFRFWTPVGETRQIVIIDDAPDFFRYEHALKGAGGRFDNFLPCINEVANCPACSTTDKPAYFAMYLSVIDLTPYTNKDGIEVPWSKKLLVVKSAQQKKITRLLDSHGSLRGMVLDMTRDGDKDAAIGNDIEFNSWMEEAELETYYDTYKDKDNNDVVIDCMEPFDYEDIFPDLTEEQIAIMAGATEHGVGNRRQTDREIGRGGRAAPAGRGAPAARGGRDAAAPTRPRRGEPAEEPIDDAPQRPARGARQAPAPAARPTRGGRAPAPAAEEQYDDDAQYDDQAQPETPPARPTRGGRAPAAAAPAARPTRGAARAPAEDAPQRPARGGRGRADAPAEEPPFEPETPPARTAARSAQRARR